MTKKLIAMEEKIYQIPEVEVVEITTESFICQSGGAGGGGEQGGGDPI